MAFDLLLNNGYSYRVLTDHEVSFLVEDVCVKLSSVKSLCNLSEIVDIIIRCKS